MAVDQIKSTRRSTEWRGFVYRHVFRLAAKLRLRSLYHHLVDKFEGIDTAGDVLQSEIGLKNDSGDKYGPGGWWDLKMTLGKKVAAEDVFIDFGSGKGRMVYLAARQYPFCKVIGVEFSEKLNNIAKNNIQRNLRKLRCRNVQLVCANVSDYTIPDDVTIVYMYDPFKGEVFVDLIKRLRISLERHPRKIRIIYRNPVMHECLIENGFRVELKLPSLTVYT